jgi:hypothetical protein
VTCIRTNLSRRRSASQDRRQRVPWDPDVAQDALGTDNERAERDRRQVFARSSSRSDDGSSEISAASRRFPRARLAPRLGFLTAFDFRFSARQFGISRTTKPAALLAFITDIHALGLKTAQGLYLTPAGTGT